MTVLSHPKVNIANSKWYAIFILRFLLKLVATVQDTIKYHTTDRICKIHVGDVVVGQVGRLCGCGPCSKPRYRQAGVVKYITT